MNREKPEEEDESEKQLRDDKLLSNEWSTSNGADLKRGGGEKKRKGIWRTIDRNWLEFANEMDLEMDHEGRSSGTCF